MNMSIIEGTTKVKKKVNIPEGILIDVDFEEITKGKIHGDEKPREIIYIPTQTPPETQAEKDQKMKEAFERFKASQKLSHEEEEMKKNQQNENWTAFETGNKERLEKKQVRMEQRSSESSTSRLGASARFSAQELSGKALEEKEQQKDILFINKEKHALLENQLLQIQEALQEAHQERDQEAILLLEEQEKNIFKQVNEYREENPTIAETIQKQVELAKKNVEHINDERTNEKLHQLGIDFQELVTVVPGFSEMTEGQRAYILYKAEQQSIERIQEKADADFSQKQSQSGIMKRLFKSGSMRREANREAVNAHVGLDAFKADIETMTKHVQDGKWDISINDEGIYRIEYAQAPEGIDENQKDLFDEYNQAATVLSDIPYEWTLRDASKKERKAFEQAHKSFEVYENYLMKALEVNGEAHLEILEQSNSLRTQVELNQFFSSYPGVSQKLDSMKNASLFDDLTKKIINPASVGIVAGAGTRILSKALWGLGGASGVSFIIGGIMSTLRKKKEFKEDTKSARRGKETKKTTDKVFDAESNVNRINKLLVKLETDTNEESRERTFSALEDRMQLLDERLTSGRVNFGKSKDQLKNKSELIKAMAAVELYKYNSSQEFTYVSKRVVQYFEKQDKKTSKERTKQYVKAATIGGLVGAGSATASWMIADYFRGGEFSHKITDAVKQGFGFFDSIQDAVPPVTPIDEILPPPPSPPEPINESQVVPPIGNIQNPYRNFPGIGAGKEAWEAINESQISNPLVDSIIEGPVPNPTDFEVSVDASSKGAIATFANLQEELKLKYPDISKAPAHIQEFLSKSPTQLAVDKNFYNPDQVNESAKIYKGGKLGFNKSGELVYTDARNGIDNLTTGKFDGEHFDYGVKQSAKEVVNNKTSTNPWQQTLDKAYNSNPDQYHPDTPWETDKKPWLEGVDENGVKRSTEPMSPEKSDISSSVSSGSALGLSSVANPEVSSTPGAERIALTKDFSVDFALVEDTKGNLQSKFYDVDLNKFNTYHRAYLNEDLSNYARNIANTSSFLEQNPGVKASQVEQDLRRLTNEMIMRDQVLQEGHLDTKSNEYKILQRERNLIRQRIKNNFEWFSDQKLVNSFDGNKYPDPKYVFDAIGVEQPSVETVPTSAQEATQSTNQDVFSQTPKVENLQSGEVLGNNTESAQNLKFSVTRDVEGNISEMKALQGTVNPSKVSLKEFGYNENWQGNTEFLETFKNTPTSKKLISDIEIIKKYTAFRNTFSSGSDEFKYLDSAIKQRVSLVEGKYPSIFN